MGLFKRKSKEIGWDIIAEKLSQLEPKRMERLVEIAKDIRTNRYNLDVFINGRPDEVDKIVKEIE